MMNSRIRFRDADEVVDFVDKASKCDFKITILDRKRAVDAKSILGVFSMDLSNVLIVRSYGDDPDFDRTVEKYSIS